MEIKTIKVQNFRLLKNVKVDLQDELTLFIGKNNSGKTSFIVLLEKFLKSKDFGFDDFPLGLRTSILNLDEGTEDNKLTIRLGMEMEYSEKDDLTHISSFIHDLDEEENTVNILFQAKINKDKILKKVNKIDDLEKRQYYIKKNLHLYMDKDYFLYDQVDIFHKINTDNLIKKELSDIQKLVNLEIIHAKRDVATSNDVNDRYKVISRLTSKYFNEKNKENDNYLDEINDLLLEVDGNLQNNYESTFKNLLETTKGFLNETEIKVESNLESEAILKYSSRVTYGNDKENRLPENYKGLGYTNLIYLVLTMEIKLMKFANNKANINLIIIEEPEAHTHPQLQSVFIRKLKENIQKWMDKEFLNLQSIVTSHSSKIVDHCDFEDLRYFKVDKKEIEIKNFVKELESKYKGLYDVSDDKDRLNPTNAFKFIKQYINIHTSELFFTDKIIMVEGVTESMLLDYFINKEAKSLNSQNVTILEVGANAKVFYPLLDFLEVKTLIITDIDSIKKVKGKLKDTWKKDAVNKCSYTSNETLKFFYGANKDFSDDKKQDWFRQLRKGELNQKYNEKINIVYQLEEENYHARSFEDAFINKNYDEFFKRKDEILGLHKRDEISRHKTVDELYNLVDRVIEKKSDFAASLLYLGLINKVEWNVPVYIKEGLNWLA